MKGILQSMLVLLIVLAPGCTNPRQDAKNHLLLGRAKLDSGKYKDALEQFGLAGRNDSIMNDALHLSALARMNIGDYDGAIANLETLVTKHFSTDSVYYALGAANFAKADNYLLSPGEGRVKDSLFDRSVECAAKCIQSNPCYLEAYRLKALAQFRSAKYAGGLATIGCLSKLDDSPYNHILRSGLKFKLGNREGAFNDLDAIMKASGRDTSLLSITYHWMSQFQLELGQIDSAEEAANRAIRLDPQRGVYYSSLGEICLARNDTSEACKNFQRAADLGCIHAYELLRLCRR